MVLPLRCVKDVVEFGGRVVVVEIADADLAAAVFIAVHCDHLAESRSSWWSSAAAFWTCRAGPPFIVDGVP